MSGIKRSVAKFYCSDHSIGFDRKLLVRAGIIAAQFSPGPISFR